MDLKYLIKQSNPGSERQICMSSHMWILPFNVLCMCMYMLVYNMDYETRKKREVLRNSLLEELQDNEKSCLRKKVMSPEEQ